MPDYLSVVYDEQSHPYTDYPSKLCAHLFETYHMKPGMKLLEPGYGRGEFLSGFKDLGLQCAGLDRSSETTPKLLRESGIPLEVWDVEGEGGMPFPDASFDVVYNKSFLEHLGRPETLLHEARRVLKPGGLLLCLVPDWESNYKIYFDDFTHQTPFTVVSLRDILLISDFEDVAVRKFRQLPIVWRYPALNYLCAAISPFVPVRTKNKFLRWSRELMLVGCGYKASA